MIGAPILIDGARASLVASGRASMGRRLRIDALRRTRASSAPRVGDPAWVGRLCPPKRYRRDKPGDGNHQKGARASP
jgi:hypothetical protein